MLQSVTECNRVLQSIAECYRLLQSITEYYRVFLAHLLGPIFGLIWYILNLIYYKNTISRPLGESFSRIELAEILFKRGAGGELLPISLSDHMFKKSKGEWKQSM